MVMAMLVGLVYKVTAERAGRQSLDDLMKSSLSLMRSELREIPLKDWNKTIATLDLNLSFQLHIEPLDKRDLGAQLNKRLRAGEIIALDDEYTFLQRIPRSHYVLAVGPVPYLFLFTPDEAARFSIINLDWPVVSSSGISLDETALERSSQIRKCRSETGLRPP